MFPICIGLKAAALRQVTSGIETVGHVSSSVSSSKGFADGGKQTGQDDKWKKLSERAALLLPYRL